MSVSRRTHAGGGPKLTAIASGTSDHRINEFDGYESPEWLGKQKLEKEARSTFKGKVIAIYTSLFFELGFVHPIRTSRLVIPLCHGARY